MSNIATAIKNSIPNAITSLNLLCGALACVAAFSALDPVLTIGGSHVLVGYEVAVMLIALAAVADFLDGCVARIIGAVSGIGKEHDSLSDLVSFGLAPAMVLYNLMRAANPDSLLCFAAMIIPVFGALRLAKFNVDTTQSTTFRGLPIPSNAIFWIGFTSWYATHHSVSQWVVVALVVVLSLLMVCNLRMFSLTLHSLRLQDSYRQWLLAVAFVAFVAIDGLSGLAWAIAFYVLLSAVAGTGAENPKH